MRSTIQYAFLLPFDIHLTHHILFFDQHLDNKVDSDDNHNNNNGDVSDDDGSVVVVFFDPSLYSRHIACILIDSLLSDQSLLEFHHDPSFATSVTP